MNLRGPSAKLAEETIIGSVVQVHIGSEGGICVQASRRAFNETLHPYVLPGFGHSVFDDNTSPLVAGFSWMLGEGWMRATCWFRPSLKLPRSGTRPLTQSGRGLSTTLSAPFGIACAAATLPAVLVFAMQEMKSTGGVQYAKFQVSDHLTFKTVVTVFGADLIDEVAGLEVGNTVFMWLIPGLVLSYKSACCRLCHALQQTYVYTSVPSCKSACFANKQMYTCVVLS